MLLTGLPMLRQEIREVQQESSADFMADALEVRVVIAALVSDISSWSAESSCGWAGTRGQTSFRQDVLLNGLCKRYF
jgi:hypothetical protein